MKSPRVLERLAASLLAVMVTAACVSVEQPGFMVDAPVLLRPGADALRGLAMDRVVTAAATTVETTPLDSRSVRRLAQQSGPAVVSIYVRSDTPVRIRLLPIPFLPGFRVRVPGIGLGSGFFVHPSGYVLTNNHVVANAREIRALTHDEVELDLEVVARDPTFDLALLRVLKPEKEFPVLPMGDSDQVGEGDLVIAVGNPLGLGHTVTSGIISQTGRNLQGVEDDEARRVAFLQTDTAINPGSSGGPLISTTGAFVGVNTAGVVQAQNIGFAVPSNQVREFLRDVLAGEGDPDRG